MANSREARDKSDVTEPIHGSEMDQGRSVGLHNLLGSGFGLGDGLTREHTNLASLSLLQANALKKGLTLLPPYQRVSAERSDFAPQAR